MIQDVKAAMAERTRGTELIVAEDLNVDLESTGGRGQDEEITAAVLTAGLEDLLVHFLPSRIAWNRYRRMWANVRQGREMRSWTDYILGSNCRIFQNVAVRDLRHNSDHCMVLGCLKGAFPRKQSKYLELRALLPLRLPGRQARMRADKIFAEL